MAAFRRAVELGAPFLETDLQLSRDARLVAMHDSTLDRTTSGRGPLNRLTLDELRRLDAGSWFGPQFSGEKIPTLEEILGFANQADVVFYLELKPVGAWGAAHTLVSAITEAQAAARAVVISFDAAALASVRRRDPTLMTGLLFDHPIPSLIEQAQDLGARQLAPRGDLVTPELLAAAHGAGLKVVAWTINEPGHMRTLIAAGVDGIITDYPDRLLKVLHEAGEQQS